MALVALDRVSMHYGGPVLLDQVSLEVGPGARVGVIGPNGCGKSTLLRILAGELEPAAGTVLRERGARVAMQAQEPQGTRAELSVFEEMRVVFAQAQEREGRLRRIEERLAVAGEPAERDALLADYARVEREHHSDGGYDVDRRIATMLSALGVPEASWTRPFASFSGGERSVLGLARVLLAEPDVLLLDEPSNHLDMEGVEWFIEFLAECAGAVVMVSHNRHLLDASVDVVWEVGGGRVVPWTGSYADYVRQKEEARALQERQYEVQQRLVRRIEFQARRMKDMANAYDDPGQARRARSMLKRLERLETVERPDAGPRRFHVHLKGTGAEGRLALAVRDLTLVRGERTLLEGATLEIEQGERVALVGPNGSGKTSLLNAVLAEGAWENPVLRLGKSVKAAAYRQFHDDLDPALSLEEWLWRKTRWDHREVAALLHRFLFTRDDLARAVGTLSGGEKSRLQLAWLAAQQVNFLILDEPTNHLDIPACETLEEMLEEYDGTLLVVSHDRYFLDRLVTRVVEVADRRLRSHPMGFTEWWRKKREAGGRRRRALADHAGAPPAPAGDRPEAADPKGLGRVQRKHRTRLQALERDISRWEARQAEASQGLEAAAGERFDRERLERLQADFETARARLADLYREWEDVAAALEGS